MTEQTVKRVLVTSALSETSPAVIAAGVDAAQHFGAELVVLHVFDPEEYERIFQETGMPLDAYLGSLRAKLSAQIQTARVELPARLEIAGSRHIAREIVATATRLHASLIVIGAHGRRGVRPARRGRVVAEVLWLARIPVLVVPMWIPDVVPRAAAAS